jgi:glycosyltransferase-like protein
VRLALLTYSTRPRGGVVHTLSLAEALARRGVEVTVFALGRRGDTAFFRPVAGDVATRVVPLVEVDGEPFGHRILRSIDALAAAVDPDDFDLVHAQDCISANAVPGCVRTVHHVDAFTTPELAACHQRALVTPTAHLCVSRAVADELAAGWGIRATVIPNGVDAERFAAAACADPAAATARRRWRDRIGAPYVLAVGGIEPRKGSIDLAEAFALFAVAHPRHRLVMAGGETLFDYRPYRAAFDDRCAVLGLEPMLLGPVDDADLPSLVAGADVFAFPSTREGFGLAAMEALAAGVPVVARDLPVFREVFGRAALLGASPAEMAALLSEAVEGPSDERAAAGRSLAAGLTWDDAAAAHLAWYGRHVASTVWKVSR